MGVLLRSDFPKYLAVINLNNQVYEVKTYATISQMMKYTAKFPKGHTVERYEHNGKDYIKI